MRSEPYTLPEPGVWHEAGDVTGYAETCLAAVGLEGWSFGWDRAVRRLGCCRYDRRLITLSRHYVAVYLERDAEMIRRTILHEVAHALAMVQHGATGHGRVWQHYCRLLGIGGEKASCRCDDFTPPHYSQRQVRYVLCHAGTGEIFRCYTRRPRLTASRLAYMYITGRREETLGQLVLREV